MAGHDASAPFDYLSPDLAVEAVEGAWGLRLDGTVSTYPSYINRVYGFRTEEGEPLVAKFYRPERWPHEAILEEHRFVADCAHAELPVVAPLESADGSTLATLELEIDDRLFDFHFALYPKRGGRNFDAESAEDWRRLGSLVGRLHRIGSERPAGARRRFDSRLARSWMEELMPLVHAEVAQEFSEIVETAFEGILPRLENLALQRIHGDLHRGNILERPGEGLLLIDFDDCMMGPRVQDLWLLLPDRANECRRELSLLLEGYGEFSELEAGSVAFIEPLRFLRMLHFLAWRARQREDAWFARDFPDWGTRGYWRQETESLRDQLNAMGREEPSY